MKQNQLVTAKRLTAFAVLAAACILSTSAMALPVPAQGSFAYDLYDIGINQMLLGAPGFVAGVACIVIAAILAVRQLLVPAAGVVLGAAFLLKADTVIQSFGGMIR